MLFGLLGGVLGSLIVLAAGVLIALRLDGGPARPPRAPLMRLRTARDQMRRTLGPAGASVLFLGAGVFVVTAFGIPLGEGVERLENKVDVPIHRWVEDTAAAPDWHRVLLAIGRMGDMWETWIGGLVCAALLTLLAPAGRRWVPAVAVSTTILVEYYQQVALARIVDRGTPVGADGTFPSGGCARLITIAGISLFLLFAYTGVSRRVQGLGWALLATLAYLEGFTRLYVSKHWFTDVPSGWIYGAALLAVLIFAVRPLLHPPGDAAGEAAGESAGSAFASRPAWTRRSSRVIATPDTPSPASRET